MDLTQITWTEQIMDRLAAAEKTEAGATSRAFATLAKIGKTMLCKTPGHRNKQIRRKTCQRSTIATEVQQDM